MPRKKKVDELPQEQAITDKPSTDQDTKDSDASPKEPMECKEEAEQARGASGEDAGSFAHLAAEGFFGNIAGLEEFGSTGALGANDSSGDTCGEQGSDKQTGNDDGESAKDGKKEPVLPEEMAVFPIRHTVVFPFMLTPVQASREKSIRVIDSSQQGETLIAIATQKDSEDEDPGPKDLYPFATAAKVIKTLKLPDGSVNLLVQGLHRISLVEFTQVDPYMKAKVELVPEVIERSLELEGLIRNAQGLFQKIVGLTPYLPDELAVAALNIDDPERLADFIASSINLSVEEKARLLSEGNVTERFRAITVFLNREFEIVETGAKIQSQVRSEVDKSQREYYLRRQMELIQQELGQGDDHAREIEELRKAISEAGMTKEAEEEARRELDRLDRMHPSSAEYTVSRSYIDWMVNIPWKDVTEDNLSLKQSQTVLDEDHYGLTKVKDRILEYLAVRKLKEDMKGPILCLTGPPGVGKTSLGQSIAKALGRKFVRVSLGGIHDEAEIRGHRRTYIGALPGKVIQGLRKAGTRNPVFMLDEIDKVGADYRGDPSSALLEVLDPQQNGTFQDHYLGVSFDLSQVMFITTANIMDPIPPALRDRMEVIGIPGYTEDEKLNIAKGYLIPRQLKSHGLNVGILTITDDAVLRLIRDYTREAGVRNLEREIANLCRKVARDIALKLEDKPAATPEPETAGSDDKDWLTAATAVPDGVSPSEAETPGEGIKPEPNLFEGMEPITLGTEDVERLLGIPRYHRGSSEREDEIGVVTGLSWTPVGGEILFIEVAMVEGTGRLTLTGRLGETMQESAKAALTYARTRAESLGYPTDFNQRVDMHIHVPEGAIPKDGPSAGVTMATALISALTGRPVRKDTAMTGEITLRGRVLPIGGIKEKVLAAHREGIRRVLLPSENLKDVSEIPENVRKDMELILVSRIDEVLENALDWGTVPRPPKELAGKAKAKKRAKKPVDGESLG